MPAPWKATWAAALACATFAWAPAAHAAPVVTEYKAGATGYLTGIAAGPGQHLFYTALQDPGAVGLLDADGGGLVEWIGGASAAFPSNRKPYDLTEGPDGAVWATESGSTPALLRVAVGGPTGEPAATGLPGTSRLAGIVAGPDGKLWITDRSGEAAILEYDLTAGTVKPHVLTTKDAQPEDIAVGPDGNLWFTAPGGDGAIGRITPNGTVTEFRAGLTPKSHPNGITAGPDGALWFTEHSDPGRVGRITTDGAITEFEVPGAADLTGIAAGDDGTLWFTASKNPGAIGRITTAGVVTLHTDGLTPDSEPLWIAEGPDGNMWFTEGATDGAIGRITIPPAAGTPFLAGAGADQVTLHAAVRPNAQATTYHVEYGTTKSYGVQTAEAPAGAGLIPKPLTVTLSGLAPATTYHARVVATNAAGTTYGTDVAFTTAPPGTVPDDDPGSGGTLPPLPEMGEIVVAAPVKGTVRVRTPRGRFVPLRAGAGLPPRSIIDARRGRVTLASEIVGGRVQVGEFWGGMFEVRQSRTGDGTTDLLLRGRLACPRRAGKATASAAARRKRRRGLWGKDDHGKFRTHGRGSVATVRGTRWYTQDRCRGTLTRVTSGKVAVRDLRRHRTVLVRAGRSYFARLRR